MNLELLLDQTLYPVDSIMGSAYVFTDRCYVLLDRVAENQVKVALTAKPGTSGEAFAAIAGEFQNELLAQALRRHIGERHAKVRELIVARAMFGAAPELEAPAPALDEAALGVDAKYVPASDDDFLDDPLGIAVPWEEKYGKPVEKPTADAAAATDQEPKP